MPLALITILSGEGLEGITCTSLYSLMSSSFSVYTYQSLSFSSRAQSRLSPLSRQEGVRIEEEGSLSDETRYYWNSLLIEVFIITLVPHVAAPA